MRLVSTAELKNQTNEVLRTALSGEAVIVTRHGRPIASVLRLGEGDLEALAARALPREDRPAAGRPSRGHARRGRGRGPADRFGYAAYALPYGTFYVAFGPRGPVFARLAPSAASFEREAARYLGVPAHPAPPPRGLTAAVEAARRHAPVSGAVDLSRVGPFERDVLEVLRRIPAGDVRTYGEVARTVGEPGAARAVGAACARNPLPLLIPCHRVIRADGGLGGYSLRGGVGLKRRLLAEEGALADLFGGPAGGRR